MLNFFRTSFEGFCREDFQAYEPEKWSSNVYTRPRMRVREKLDALGQVVQTKLVDAGLELKVETNDAAPTVFNGHCVESQLVYFTRPDAARKALSTVLDSERSLAETVADPAHQKRHLALVVEVDVAAVRVYLGLHRNAWVDSKNGAQKLEDAFEADVVGRVFEKVEAVCPGLGDLERDVRLTQMNAESLSRDLTELATGARTWLRLGRCFSWDRDEVGQPGFVDAAGEVLVALSPLYRFLVWSADNDHLGLRAQMQARKVVNATATGLVAPGDAVAITAGLFAGKRGSVLEIDKKGLVRVAIGAMVVQIKTKALRRV